MFVLCVQNASVSRFLWQTFLENNYYLLRLKISLPSRTTMVKNSLARPRILLVNTNEWIFLGLTSLMFTALKLPWNRNAGVT